MTKYGLFVIVFVSIFGKFVHHGAPLKGVLVVHVPVNIYRCVYNTYSLFCIVLKRLVFTSLFLRLYTLLFSYFSIPTRMYLSKYISYCNCYLVFGKLVYRGTTSDGFSCSIYEILYRCLFPFIQSLRCKILHTLVSHYITLRSKIAEFLSYL